MSAHARPIEPEPALQGDDELYRSALHELLAIGMDVARDVGHQAKARAEPASPPPTTDLTAQFDRISRAIRRTILLARHLRRPLANAAPDRVAARKRIIREVEDAIDTKAQGPRAESLRGELADRLDAPDLEDDIQNRPVPEIIADICRDLGLVGLPGSRPPLEAAHPHRNPGPLRPRRHPARQPQPETRAPAPTRAATRAAAPRSAATRSATPTTPQHTRPGREPTALPHPRPRHLIPAAGCDDSSIATGRWYRAPGWRAAARKTKTHVSPARLTPAEPGTTLAA